MVLAAVLILGTWARYRTALYPIFVGIVFLPITYFLFPQNFLVFALLLAALATGMYLWYILVRQPSQQ